MHDFTAKRNALFACLDDASNELKGTVLDQTNLSADIRTDKLDLEFSYLHGGVTRKQHTLRHLRGKESIFKKPELPITRCVKPRKLPDYQVNPHKWKKYSLEDVDISDQTNSTAAIAFLRQIEQLKDNMEKPEIYEEEEKKIEFKKSSKIRCNLKAIQSAEQMDAEVDSPKLKGSKLVMPEYVIGQKKTTTTKKKSFSGFVSNNEKRKRAEGKLLLSHLQQDDEADLN